MEIIINENTSHKGSGGNVTAEIFLQTGDNAFPACDWSDFPIIIVGNWLNEYMSFDKTQKERKFEFYFMDGSYKMTGKTTHSNCYQLTFIKQYWNMEEILYKEETNIKEFEQTLLKACRKILRIMSKTGTKNDNIRNCMTYLKDRLQPTEV